MDPISLAVGAAILGAGFLAGRFRRPGRSTGLQYTCSCEHPLSFHDPKTKTCHGTIGWDKVSCTCKQYVGEMPLDLSVLNQPLPPPSSDKP